MKVVLLQRGVNGFRRGESYTLIMTSTALVACKLHRRILSTWPSTEFANWGHFSAYLHACVDALTVLFMYMFFQIISCTLPTSVGCTCKNANKYTFNTHVQRCIAPLQEQMNEMGPCRKTLCSLVNITVEHRIHKGWGPCYTPQY